MGAEDKRTAYTYNWKAAANRKDLSRTDRRKTMLIIRRRQCNGRNPLCSVRWLPEVQSRCCMQAGPVTGETAAAAAAAAEEGRATGQRT